MLARKIITATISGTLFALLLGFIFPNPFGDTGQNYFYTAITVVNVYLMYSFPVILFYGVLTSIASDKIAEFLTKKDGNIKKEILISGVFHVVFGLVLLPFSLGAALLFFVIDRLLQKRKNTFHWLQALKCLAIPVFVWIALLGLDWINHIITELTT
ncbi:hypothetical protein J14TS2_12490 [Bacillus sp. J14TS2]|uniref:hypothetical protein n=1 Tax=Bacillus sp. J14TS2 TaxID=2807188 RepID=UPI001AFD2FFE|nr:hypothetical protein [Bacillus sp. J14TS2]GIN70774.1 hypothetical protein J14TS2_12490 [Bacillus sp. J14TS2]